MKVQRIAELSGKARRDLRRAAVDEWVSVIVAST